MVPDLRTPRGMVDSTPEEEVFRQRLISHLVEIFNSYGFVPIQTPAIELTEVLTKKYGEDERLIYHLAKEGKEDISLRYDLTVPLARYMAMNPQTPLPFKRYHIDRVWRRERPQRGRFREFTQCDIDILGTNNMLADAEIIAIIAEVMEHFGFKEYNIRLNNRKILSAMERVYQVPKRLETSVLIAIDKLEKIGIDGVREELESRGLEPDIATLVLDFIQISGENHSVLDRFNEVVGCDGVGATGVMELRKILRYLPDLGVKEDVVVVDPSMVRGLDYYTGPIFETVATEPKVGSITGGGRYDELLGAFSKTEIPAVGTSFGFERMVEVLQEQGAFKDESGDTHVIVIPIDDDMLGAALSLSQDLRKKGIAAEVPLVSKKISKLLSYANRRGIRWALFVGPDEFKEGKVNLKDLKKGEQETMEPDEVPQRIRGES